MAFLKPFIAGTVAGGVVIWQWRCRRPRPQRLLAHVLHADGNGAATYTNAPEHQQPADTRPSPAPPPPQPDRPDQLEAINGIGPVFAGRLREAGVTTFARLAVLSKEQIRAIVSPDRAMPLADVEDWITQARRLQRNP